MWAPYMERLVVGKPRAFTDEQERSEIAPKYQAGALLCDLADEYGVNKTTIVRALERVGVPRRKGVPRPGIPRPRPAARLFNEEQELELAVSYRAGALVADLAAEAEVSRKAVNNALRRQGVELRSRRDASLKRFAQLRAEGGHHVTWKGGRHLTGEGYVRAWVDPADPLAAMRFGGGYVLEHRLVMARHLGRPLTSSETVHHVNGDRSDNRLENLQLRTGRHGKGRKCVCADCGSANIREVPI